MPRVSIIIIFITLFKVFTGFCEDNSSYKLKNDTVSANSSKYELIGLNEHIGFNGLSLFFSFVKQIHAENTTKPKAHTFGAGISGDVLTGLSFIHLIPVFQYWQYSEKLDIVLISGDSIKRQTYRDISLSFNSVLFSPRFSNRKARLFLGGGPSLHLTILSQYNEYNNAITMPSFKNGIGIIGGLELPLSGIISFLLTGTYKQTYDWNNLYRKYFTISMGLAV